ncbi:short-chain dehydrogenase/reductase SDR [Kribbella flavida DSM 17836]|uniref:Short-chain dehydrogenase/reductase SDR n=1 Tax=Kribbella flavida (strain DSM 17836 / JCM 10339 / NBRC 14399) TaxID=479435 RepID=D2PWS0_KRIFD|nr:SDR family oxidoreductase [Kribbella flavida]ADB33539.1 short-chain dehydrogenase/reductase SDR [Kribbella flavida DSM 17836]
MLAVVAGAGGGIGRACARALAVEHDVVLCVDRDEQAAAATAASLNGGTDARSGRPGDEVRAVAFVADAENPEFGASVARRAAEFGSVRSAVYAIAHEEHVPAGQLSRASMMRSLTVGPVAAFEFFRALPPAAGASYVTIGSLHASEPFQNCLGYNAAHGALAQVVRTLAHEWAERRIRVNAVVPGWIATPGEEAFYGADTLAKAAAGLPFGALGRPEQVADAVAFLASDAAAYISGSFLTVDGGLSVSLARLPGI